MYDVYERGWCGRIALALLPVAVLVCAPSNCGAWSSYKVAGYTLDVSLESDTRATARLTLAIEVRGGRFRGFKVARADEGLDWVETSMYCENSSGKRYVLRRVPRADGLTAFKFVTPGFIPRGSAVCSVSYEIDPAELGTLSAFEERGEGQSSDEPRLRFTYKTPGLPVAVEDWVVTVHLPEDVAEDRRVLGELAAEEYTVQHFPRAITLRRYRPPAYYTGNVDIVIPARVLVPRQGEDDAAVGIVHLDRFIGIDGRLESDGGPVLWVLVAFALLVVGAVSLKNRSTDRADGLTGSSHPFLVLPSLGSFTRLALTCTILVGFVALAAGGLVSAAVIVLAVALTLNLRGGLVLPGRDEEPGEGRETWIEVDEDESMRRIAQSRRREAAARMHLDATTPAGAIATVATLGALAVLLTIGPERWLQALGPAAPGSLAVVSFVMLTSTRLGGASHISRRAVGKLIRLARAFEREGFRPSLCVREPARDPLTDLRCRVAVESSSALGGAILEVGMEWRSGIAGWRSCHAVVIRLGARAGALVADSSWLERAEVHTRPDRAMTAIVVRTRDPLMPVELARKLGRCLDGGAPTTDVGEVISVLGLGQRRDGTDEART